MMQVVSPDKEYTIKIQSYDDSYYLAWIEGSEYKGLVIQSVSLVECLKELQVSLKVLELYRKNG